MGAHASAAIRRGAAHVVHAHGGAQAGQVPALSPVAASVVAAAQGAVLAAEGVGWGWGPGWGWGWAVFENCVGGCGTWTVVALAQGAVLQRGWGWGVAGCAGHHGSVGGKALGEALQQ